MDYAAHIQAGMAGLLVGYIAVSACESFFHRTLGHASPALRQRCKAFGFLGRLILRAWYSHTVVHHHMTFRHHYLEQFSSDEEEHRLREKLIASGRGHIIGQSYGLKVGPLIDYFLYVAPTLPVMALVFAAGGLWLDGYAFHVGALVPLVAMPLMSEFVHPLLHLSHDRAVQEAPALLRPLVRSRYFRFAARHHWLHHRHPQVNFNTMLAGDWLLGTAKAPTVDELEEMKALGLCVRGTPVHA